MIPASTLLRNFKNDNNFQRRTTPRFFGLPVDERQFDSADR